MHRVMTRIISGIALVLCFATAVAAQVPRPSDVWGFEPGADYELADYAMVVKYLEQLDAASDRVQMIRIGESTLGRPMLLLFISSEENLRQLERWKGISQRLARARDLTDAEARQLAEEGKTIVWIDGGLHATEMAHGQMTSELAWKVATEESEEMRRIRDDVVLLLMPNMNPDGLDIVSNWYHRNLGTPFETTNPPTLYHHYVGHDNNRDSHLLLQKETQNYSRVKWLEWYPQLTYNHHQSGPYPGRISIAPYDDPLNPDIPPLVVRSLTEVGAHMAKRFAEENKPGVLSRLNYGMWMPDAVRYADYFHNMVGAMSEAQHPSPTPRYVAPEEVPDYFRSGRSAPLSAKRPSVFYPDPWPGGWLRLRETVEYMITGSMGMLDLSSRLKEDWLYNIYRMGRDAIARGEAGNPYAYVVPASQWDENSAVEMLAALRRGGVDIHRATAPFTAAGRRFDAGDWVIFAGQPNRAWILTLLEPQDHPNDLLYPGGPPNPPYDLAGWTLPIQMGVETIRVDEPFQVSTQQEVEEVRREPGAVAGEAGFGYLVSHRDNGSFRAVNRLLAAGERVSWTGGAIRSGGQSFDAGTFVVQSHGERTRQRVQELARELGVDFAGIGDEPSVELHPLSLPRVALYKSWTANMDEGWTRWILEQWEFPVDTVHDADIRGGDLSRYDVIVLPSEEADRILNGNEPGTMPPEFVGGLGAEGAAALNRYVERGGTVVALDGASDFAIRQFGLPVRNVVTGLNTEQFFIPGSLIRLSVDPSQPLGYGMQESAAAFFVDSRGFEVVEPARSGESVAAAQPVSVVARYGSGDLLLSGWELGAERYLKNRPAVLQVRKGDGDVVLIGFRAQFRGQPRGTFKLLFNAIYWSTLDRLRRPAT